MAHRERFMQRLGQDRWIVACRLCGSNRHRMIAESARQCHSWWNDHTAGTTHQRMSSSEVSAQLRHARQVRHMGWEEFLAHATQEPKCEYCATLVS